MKLFLGLILTPLLSFSQPDSLIRDTSAILIKIERDPINFMRFGGSEAQFPCGTAALMKFVSEKTKYPKEAILNNEPG